MSLDPLKKRRRYTFPTSVLSSLSLLDSIFSWITMMMMNDEELFFLVSLTNEMQLALFPAETIVRDPNHRESPTRPEQDLNLRIT